MDRIEESAEGATESLVVQRLREQFEDPQLEVKVWRNETTVILRPQDLQRACRFLRDDPDLGFDFLSDVTGVDRLNLPDNSPRFEVVYHLYSLQYKRRIRLKVRVNEGEAVPTVTGVWETANWHEREVFDLFGVPALDPGDRVVASPATIHESCLLHRTDGSTTRPSKR